MKKSLKRKIAVSVLSAALLFQATPSFAAPTYNAATYDNKIEALNTEIEKFDNEIIEALAKVEKLNKQVEESKTKVETTKTEIAELEESYERSLELSKKRLEQIQLNGSMQFNFVEIVFSSSSISDFVEKTTAVMTVMESDKELMDSLSKKENELKEKKAELEAELVSIQDKQAEAKEAQKAIESAKAQVEAEVASVQQAKEEAEEAARIAAEEEARRIAAEQAAAAEEAANNASQPETTTDTANNSNTNTGNTNNGSNNSTKPKPTTKPVVTDNGKISASASAVIAEAKKYLGVPYKWGGTSPSGFDCSGFTSYVFKKAGISLPRVSRAQQNVGTQVSVNNVQPGDLVFKGKPAYHVGIYIGGGQWIHAPRTGDVVKIASYNPSKFSSATRVLR